MMISLLALGLAACQQSEAPKAPAPAESMAPAQPAANEVRDVKEPATSPLAAMETAAKDEAAKQVLAEVQQSEPAKPVATAVKQAESVAAQVPAPAAPVATPVAAPKPVAAAPVVAAAKPAASALPTGNAANGEKLAGKCKTCHNFNDKKKVGPGLAGVVGRKAGSMADMAYSASLKGAGWVWDAAHLAPWLCNTVDALKEFTGDAGAKTKMPSQRICDPQQQADMIAYLKTLK